MIHRRTLLRGGLLGGVGLAAAALIGCGGDDDDGDTAAVAPATQVAADGDDSAAPAETVEAEDTVATIERANGFTSEAGRFVPFQIEEPATAPKSAAHWSIASHSIPARWTRPSPSPGER